MRITVFIKEQERIDNLLPRLVQAYDWLHVLDWALTDKLPHATVIWLVESYLGPVGVDDIPVIVRTQLPAIGEIDYVMIVGELQLLQLSANLVRLGKEEIDRALVTLQKPCDDRTRGSLDAPA